MTANLIEMKAWYQRQFRARAYPTRAATVLLVAVALLAGSATSATLLCGSRNQPSLAITQTQTTDDTGAPAGPANHDRITLNVEVTFRGMTATDTATLTVTGSPPVSSAVLARAAMTPSIDGTATRTITIANISPQTTINITAKSNHQHCHTRLDLTASSPPRVACNITDR
jgi:hypothetical protein